MVLILKKEIKKEVCVLLQAQCSSKDLDFGIDSYKLNAVSLGL